jgi:hypothetical protein
MYARTCGPDRLPLARLDVAVRKAGKDAAVGQPVRLDVDRGQGLTPDQPTVRTRRPLAGGYVGHGEMGAGDQGLELVVGQLGPGGLASPGRVRLSAVATSEYRAPAARPAG